MFLDRDDPRAAWKELGRRQAGLVEFMSGARSIRIEAPRHRSDPLGRRSHLDQLGRPAKHAVRRDLHRAGRGFGLAAACDAVFRSAATVASWWGSTSSFARGEVVSARADEGEDYLLAMLDLDPGARPLGELGLGLNPGIDRFTGSILYDEKIGGTVHLALGQSYPETGGVNASALHWDLIVDTRNRRPDHGRRPGRDGKRTVARRLAPTPNSAIRRHE